MNPIKCITSTKWNATKACLWFLLVFIHIWWTPEGSRGFQFHWPASVKPGILRKSIGKINLWLTDQLIKSKPMKLRCVQKDISGGFYWDGSIPDLYMYVMQSFVSNLDTNSLKQGTHSTLWTLMNSKVSTDILICKLFLIYWTLICYTLFYSSAIFKLYWQYIVELLTNRIMNS